LKTRKKGIKETYVNFIRNGRLNVGMIIFPFSYVTCPRQLKTDPKEPQNMSHGSCFLPKLLVEWFSVARSYSGDVLRIAACVKGANT